MTENKRYNLRAGYYHNYTGIGRNKEENLTTNHARDKLNELTNENEQLKQANQSLKDTIVKITISVQRKYDNTVVNLVDEICDEDITELIKELKE